MALDPTLQEANFRRSVKKYFVDTLYTTKGIYISFGATYKEPDESDGTAIDKWINFHFDGVPIKGTLSRGRVAAFMFSRRDTDGTELAALKDELMDQLIDLTMPDGIRRVPLYDADWNVIGGMMVSTGADSKEERGGDDTLYRFINIYFNFAVT